MATQQTVNGRRITLTAAAAEKKSAAVKDSRSCAEWDSLARVLRASKTERYADLASAIELAVSGIAGGNGRRQSDKIVVSMAGYESNAMALASHLLSKVIREANSAQAPFGSMASKEQEAGRRFATFVGEN